MVQNLESHGLSGRGYSPECTPQDSINEFIIQIESIGSHRFQIHLGIPACVMSSEFTCEIVNNFLPAQFS